MGYESIAHEAKGPMGYCHEGERNNCFTRIQLVGKKKYNIMILIRNFVLKLCFWMKFVSKM